MCVALAQSLTTNSVVVINILGTFPLVYIISLFKMACTSVSNMFHLELLAPRLNFCYFLE